MSFYRKKPVVIEAVRFRGSSSDVAAIEKWIQGEEYIEPQVCTRDICTFDIDTLEGTMVAQPGDWIIKGVKGEFYPVKPEIFEMTYEKADPKPVELHPTDPDLVAINDVNLFARLIGLWHSNHLKRAEHVLTLPEGVQMQLDDDPPIILSGDVHKAFLIGANLVLSEFGVLPFVAEMDETPETPNSEPTTDTPIENGQQNAQSEN